MRPLCILQHDDVDMFKLGHTARLLCLLGALSMSLPACTLLNSFEECTTNTDCAGSNVCDDGVCVSPPSCERSSECGGDNAYCFSGLCTTIEADRCTLSDAFDDDDVILPIGALMPLTGEGIGDRGAQTIRAASIAVEELNQAGGAGSAKFGLMVCDTRYETNRAVEQAQYLSSLGIKAIIGGFSSDETIQVANKVTIGDDILLVSPSSTAASISALDDNDLVWRTVASDVLQGPALVAKLERIIADNEDLDAQSVKVGLINANTAYGSGLRETFVSALSTSSTLSELGGSANFKSVSFEPLDPIEDSAASVTSALYTDSFTPDVLILLSSAAALPLLKTVEDDTVLNLPADDKPTWLLSEAARAPALLGGDYMLVWPRITGTVISQNTTQSATQFKIKFESQGANASEYPFADKAYDAAYLIAMSMASFPLGEQPSGTQLAGRFKQMTEGMEFQLTTINFSAAVSELADGDFIDVVGASGDLGFDLSTGDVTSTVKEWSVDSSGTPMFVDGAVLAGE